ncbi:MAG: imidazole glycerol phosphate synthase subunit HisH [Synergistetes bacterium]|nr:imidazole glycerol phosphate synthase subunit HisH [Synergistota bacterium]MCX8128038.1 imidazole glycerol phosphate synthase subunit HisH [Synergistota bacterium]MDW8193076.1 imidazole glycerol phosphate synthase subunit HisH [Synergistota bacterium]
MIGIIDYGAGNLKSLVNAIRILEKPFRVLIEPELREISLLILPGVGAFGSAMRNLIKFSWIEKIESWIKKGNPLLGICLGMQLLFERSEEEGFHEGLKLLRGSIKKLPEKDLPIPHMGWNVVNLKGKSFLEHFQFPQYFYFAHSYYAVPEEEKIIIGETHYGINFPSIIGEENLLGFQFHPEKSGEIGLKLLNFSLEGLKRSC